MRVITFHVGSIECGLPIELVREILEPPPVTRVPGSAAALRGVTNVRGQVVPVLDVAIRIGAAAEPAARPCLLVTDRGGAVCALAVDGVRGIEDLEPGRASAPPVVLAPAEWLAAIAERDDRLVLLVDLERLLDDAAIAASRAAPRRERAASPRRGGTPAEPVAGGAPAPGGGEEDAVPAAHAGVGPAPSGIGPDAPHPERATAAPGLAARAALRARGRSADRDAEAARAARGAASHGRDAAARAHAASTARDRAASIPPPPGAAPAGFRPLASSATAPALRAAAADPGGETGARVAQRERAAIAPEAAPRARRVTVAVLTVLAVAAALAVAAMPRRPADGARVRPARTAAPVAREVRSPVAGADPTAPPDRRGAAPPEHVPAASVPPASVPAPVVPAPVVPAPGVSGPGFIAPASSRNLPSPVPLAPLVPARSAAAPTPPPAAPAPVLARPQPPAPASGDARARATAAPLRPGDAYEVVRGDTLWSISARMLLDPRRWRRLYEANRGRVADPDLIRPGQRFVVPDPAAPAPRSRGGARDRRSRRRGRRERRPAPGRARGRARVQERTAPGAGHPGSPPSGRG